MARALQLQGGSLDIWTSDGHGGFTRFDPASPLPATDRRESSLLRAEYHDALSAFIYHVPGRVIPPIFNPRDLVSALNPPSLASDLQGLIAFKPWFRTVVPVLREAKRRGILSVVWIDDFDVNARSPFLSEFSLVVVNSMYLKREYERWHPLYLPHIVEHDVVLGQEDLAARQSIRSDVAIFLPGTGLPDVEITRIVRAVLAGCEASVNLLGFRGACGAMTGSVGPVTLESPRVRLWPYLERSKVLELLDSQALVVVPEPLSRYGAAKAPGRLLECLARGAPAIVPRIGESELIAEESQAALTYDPNNVAELTEQVRRMTSDESLRQKLGTRGTGYLAKRGSWTDNVHQLRKRLELE